MATIIEPFQRLLAFGGKLLNQLDPEAACFHRAEALVLMRAFAGETKSPG
jgi:hypothetical protein